MLKNYIKIAYRNILKNKFYAFLNLMGLALGITAALFILIYIQDELSYDRFHTDAEQMYVVGIDGRIGKQVFHGIFTPSPMSEGAKREIPGIDEATRTYQAQDMIMRYKNADYTQKHIVWADSNFYNFFGFRLLKGDPSTALSGPNKIVLTQSTAEKYFGAEPALGKTLIVGNNGDSYEITGIAADPPHNSHFTYEVLISYHNSPFYQNENWLANNVNTYFKINRQSNSKSVNEKLNRIAEKNAGPLLKEYTGMSFSTLREQGGKYGYFLMPVTDLHLHASDLQTSFENISNISYVYIFGGIGILLILLACVNFMNLATAGATARAREVGVRKTMGSGRSSMITQFLIESLFYVVIAVIISLQGVNLLLPWFNELSGKALTLQIFGEWWFIVSITGLTFFISLMAGSYPAFYLTSFEPVDVLKSNLFSGGERSAFRNKLVVGQFFISIGLILCTIIVYQQLDYMQNKNLGFSKERTVQISNATRLGQDRRAFKQSLLSESQIKAASYSPFSISVSNNFTGFSKPGDDKTYLMALTYADYDFAKTMQINMKEGRFFHRDFATDSTACVINEAAVEEMGLEDPVGKEITFLDNNNRNYRIVGVMENFNFESLRVEVRPMVMGLDEISDNLYVRFAHKDPRDAISNIEEHWNSYSGGGPLTYSFIDEQFDALFRSEQRLGQVFGAFTLLAIFIACLGLLGLSAYTAEQRTREIGIRKVMGASVSSLLVLLNKDFIKLIGIAFLLAVPISWYFMQEWLRGFAYRTEMNAGVIFITILATLVVVIITVSWQSIKAATMKPVDTLQSE